MSHEDERQEQTNPSASASSSPDRPSSSSSAAAAAAAAAAASRQQRHQRSDSITKTPKHRNIHPAAAGDGGDNSGSGRPKATVPPGAENLLGLFSPPLAGAAAGGDNGNNAGDAAAAGAAAAAPIRLPPKPSRRRRRVDPSSDRQAHAPPMAVPPGAAGLVGMFAPPPAAAAAAAAAAAPAVDGGGKPNFGTNEEQRVGRPSASGQLLQRQRTEKSCNTSNASSATVDDEDRPAAHERQALLPRNTQGNANDHSAVSSQQRYMHGDRMSPSTDMRTLHDLFRPPPSPSPSVHSTNNTATSRKQLDDSTSSHRTLPTKTVQVSATDRSSAYQRSTLSTSMMDNMRAGAAARYLRRASSSVVSKWQRRTKSWSDRWCSCSARDVSSVVIGSFTFVLFQIVFCLAESSAVAGARYGAKASVLGPMMKACALGAICQVPIFVYFLSTDLPSLYPCVDLFLAPFMTQISNSVHTSLRQQGLGDDIETFLATFFVLNAIGLLTTALANIAASKFKLANLGSFLPYSVICGFFSYVGLTLWMLAIAVDTGHTWDVVLFSGDGTIFKKALVHHIPGVVVGVCMRFFGQIYPPLTPLAVLFTIGAGYVIMYSTGTTFEAAVAEGWFYSRDDFIYEKQNAHVGFVSWAPPAPFGILPALFRGTINFRALVSALPHALGMAAIYLLRCSLHAAALRKSTTSMIRAKSSEPPTLPAPPSTMHKRERSVSDAAFEPLNDDKSNESNVKPPTGMTVILLWYGICLAIGGVIGGVGVLPGVAVGAMLFKLGAGGIAPQHGGSLLLFGFYISNFALVRYIPKPAFTCLLIMCSLDMIIDWFIDSFKKTRSVWEWIVCPVIVVFSFLLGQLMAVAVGVALSTFIFVGHMNQSGVVKFIAHGLTVRSTIERGEDVADFLDQNGDLIQILVLQNYLFFGNATSVDQYVQTMFEDVRDENVEFDLPPIPKYLLIDFTIVTGIDTSAVDVFSDIISLCKSNGCDILMTGLTSNLRATFAAAGVKPTRGLRFLPDIEAALGKAEDALVRHIFKKEEKSEVQAVERTRQRLMSVDDDGFRFALRQIDEQHGVSFAEDLEDLQKFTKPIELEPGETLFGDDSEFDDEEDRGVFFIESGYMKVERDPSYTMTRGSKASLRRKIGPGIACQRVAGEGGSISHLNARSATIGREAAILKATTGFRSRTSHTFRLARIGPGWVVGAIEGASGLRNPGVHVAVTDCRLHHLPFSSVQELERTNPLLVLRLFKMMSHIMSRRQEMTIEQLATLHSIMTSPASTKPVGRLTMGAIQSAMSYQ